MYQNRKCTIFTTLFLRPLLVGMIRKCYDDDDDDDDDDDNNNNNNNNNKSNEQKIYQF